MDRWETWELRLSPVPMEKIQEQVAAWMGQLPAPTALEILSTVDGASIRMYCPPGTARGAIDSWASMMHQQSLWAIVDTPEYVAQSPALVLHTSIKVPNVVTTSLRADPLLALIGQMRNQISGDQKARLRIWLLGKDQRTQERLRMLSAYSYGTESGVTQKEAPNPWGIRLSFLRFGVAVGIIIAVICGGLLGGGWINPIVGGFGILAGGTLAMVGTIGMLDWMYWRSIPKEIIESRINDTLLRVAFTIDAPAIQSLALLGGPCKWEHVDKEWPAVRPHAFPLPCNEIGALISPPETGEVTGIFHHTAIQAVPAPPPSLPLTQAPFKVGRSVSTGEMIGIEPDGHGMAIGGSRSGKSSFVYGLLQQLIEQGENAPGIFLVDPHMSLADSFLEECNRLPENLRRVAIKRLRVVTPDQPEVIPLNLLAIPDFAWAGNSIIQVGRRIWDDYWGPRMQAALLALFQISHAWNMHHKSQTQMMGLLHVVFAAYNERWRHDALQYLAPEDRMGGLALDALLGQHNNDGRNTRSQAWMTEIISPVLSKVMALQLSKWLFRSLHMPAFVDMEKWVTEKAWIVMRLPSGEMGREGARLTASVMYNVFDAAYRRATMRQTVPFYFIVDEAQEIATGMRLEAMLSEGAKFGARMFVLAQSLSMMSTDENLKPVVKALLANTSTQAFFSPDPEDAKLMRTTLSLDERFGKTTMDLPTLHCWLRARVNYQWQPPTQMKVRPLPTPDPVVVQRMIREVILAHPQDYVDPEIYMGNTVTMLSDMIDSTTIRSYLSELFHGANNAQPMTPPKDDRAAYESRQASLQTEARLDDLDR
jgi:hypothetical protein